MDGREPNSQMIMHSITAFAEGGFTGGLLEGSHDPVFIECLVAEDREELGRLLDDISLGDAGRGEALGGIYSGDSRYHISVDGKELFSRTFSGHIPASVLRIVEILGRHHQRLRR